MHPYIKHLLEDIKNAERSKNDRLGYSKPTTFEKKMEEVERFVSGESERPISQFTGLNKENFPPSNQLTDEEMESVLIAYDQMLASWNTQIDWQKNMPINAKYDFLLKFVLDEKLTPMNFGTMHLDFCPGDTTECVWEQYCYCKKYGDNDFQESEGI